MTLKRCIDLIESCMEIFRADADEYYREFLSTENEYYEKRSNECMAAAEAYEYALKKIKEVNEL